MATPTDITLDGNEVSEESTFGEHIGFLSTEDDDIGDNFTYQFIYSLGGAVIDDGVKDSSEIFRIDGNEIKVNDPTLLDAESSLSHDFFIRVTDDQNNTHDEQFTINVLLVNDNSTTGLTFTAAAIDDTALNGDVAGSLVRTDDDIKDAATGDDGEFSFFTYSIDGGSGEGIFDIGGFNGDGMDIIVIDAASLTSQSYTLDVTFTDSYLFTAHSKTLTIDVGSLGSAPTDITFTPLITTVAENDSVEMVLGAIDPDSDESFTYEIIDDPDGKFTLDQDTITGSGFDYEDKEIHSVTVEVTDKDGHKYNEELTINVTNVNEFAPDNVALVSGGNIFETSAADVLVGKMTATDGDKGDDTFTYLFDNDDTIDGSGRFKIVGDEIFTNQSGVLDFETEPTIDLTVKASDGELTGDGDIITITVDDSGESATEVTIDNNVVNENEIFSASLGNDDPDADTFTYNIIADPDNKFTITGDTITGSGFDFETKGKHSVTVEVDDGNGNIVSSDFDIIVNDVNEDPTKINITGDSVDEDGIFSAVLTTVDPDADDQNQTVFNYTLTDPSGLFALNGDTITGTGFDHEDADNHIITVETKDSAGNIYSEDITITVNDVNDDPIALDDSKNTDEDTAVIIAVLDNDSDPDGDTISISGFDTVTANGGTVIDNLDGTLTYTPFEDYNGTDSFTYTVSDGRGGNATATVNLTVDPVNDAPDAWNDDILATEDTDKVINIAGDLLINDSDPDSGDTIFISGFDTITANGGTVIDNLDGTLTYTPFAEYNGIDSFTYTITDGNGGFDTATVNITVDPVNDAPVIITNEISTVDEGGTDTISSAELYTDDDDNTDLELVYTITGDVANGQMQLSGDDINDGDTFTQDDINNNQVTYVHDGGETTSDILGFSVTDGTSTISAQNFNLTINPINDPVVVNVNTGSSVIENGIDTISSSELDTFDPDNTDLELIYTIDTDVTKGQLQLNGDDINLNDTFTQDNINNSLVTYTPNAGYDGPDNFTFTVSDGQFSDTATFDITVFSGNEAPTLDIDGDRPGNDYEGDFNPNGGLTLISGFMVNIVDIDDVNIERARITLTNRPDGANESIYYSGSLHGLSLTTIYDDATGMQLEISGTGNISLYEDVLSWPRLRYDNTSAEPDTADRVIEVSIFDGQDWSDIAISTITICGVNIHLTTATTNYVGGDCDDHIGTSSANTTVDGGDGKDSIHSSSGNDSLIGGAGDDVLSGGSGNNTLVGGSGRDSLASGSGDDILNGGADHDYIYGYFGNDTIDGGSGIDILSYGANTTFPAVNIDLTAGTVLKGGEIDIISNIEYAHGTYNGDTLKGGTGSTVLHGLEGNDIFLGSVGATQIYGDSGEDHVDYSQSNEAVNVSMVDRTVNSGGHAQGDKLIEIELLTGSIFNDVLTGNDVDNTISGNDGDDTIDGGDGIDTADYSSASSGVNVDLVTGTASGAAGDDVLIDIEIIIGSDGSDTLRGGDASLSSTLSGGTGEDTYLSSEGATYMLGGESLERDIVDYSQSTAAVNVSMVVGVVNSGGHAEGDVLENIEKVIGSNHDDTLTGADYIASGGISSRYILNGGEGSDSIVAGSGGYDLIGGYNSDGNNTLIGGSDNDFLFGFNGNDIMIGGGGNDRFISNYGNDLLIGGDGADSIWAGGDNDTIDGGAGNDTVSGGYEADTLSGGADSDIFKLVNGNGSSHFPTLYSTAAEADLITDFEKGIDKIDVSFQGLTNVDAASSVDGDISYTYNSGSGKTEVTGNGTELYFEMIGNISLDNNDFIGLSLIPTPDDNTLLGSQFRDDTINALAGNDSVEGNNGNDILIGDSGNDTIWGNNGNDRLFGGGGTDVLNGGEGNDIIHANGGYGQGGDGLDTLDGGAGNDILVAGDDANTLTGGTGADIFTFLSADSSTGSERDVITDFEQGIDKIDVRGLGFDRIFQDTPTLNGLYYKHFAGNTFIHSNNTNFSLRLNGEHNLDTNDFMGMNSASQGKIICTELHRQGLMPSHIFEADQEFGRYLAKHDPEALIGYHMWAQTIVDWMEKSTLFTHIVKFFAMSWANEMACIMGAREKGSLFGKVLMKLGIPACRMIGGTMRNWVKVSD